MKIQLIGPFCQRTGYGQAFSDYLMALRQAGADIRIQPIIDCDTENLDDRYQELLGYSGFHDEAPDVMVVHAIPKYAHEFVTGDLQPHPKVKKVCLTTWETTKFDVEDAQNLYHNFDLIIVPSKYIADVFASSYPPLKDKLAVIPHTFDSQYWNDMPQPKARFNAEGRYVFYNIGIWSERKNSIGLLKAYMSEFRGKEPVLLRMVSPFVVEEDVIALSRCMNIEDLPKVEFLGRWEKKHGGRLSAEDLKLVHYQSDCYVTVARAEGWGLGAFEAATIGNPVVASKFSGLRDFLDDYVNTSYVPCFLTPAVSPETDVVRPIEVGGIKIAAKATLLPMGISGDQLWAEPDLQTTMMHMRRHFTNRTPRTPSAEFNRRYDYATVGKLFVDVLEELCRKDKDHGKK